VPRPTLQGRLSPDAHAAWHRALTREKVTATQLLQALGELLDEGVDWVPAEAVRRARAADIANYSRRP
jgi:hypothetical protein